MKWNKMAEMETGIEMPIRRKTSISSSDYRTNINPVEGGDIRSFRRGALRASPHLRVALACTSTDNARAIDNRYNIVSLYSFSYAPLSLSDLTVYGTLLLFFCVSMQRQMPSKWLWFQRP